MNRETLITILAALTGGVAGAVAGSIASVAITRQMINDPDFGRYAKVVKLQQTLYATNRKLAAQREACRAALEAKGVKTALYAASHEPKVVALTNLLNKQADAVLAYSMANFSGTQSQEAYYQVGDLLDGYLKIDTLSVAELQTILDEVVPVAIAKHMLSVEKCRVSTWGPGSMKNFDAFAVRYRDMILGGKGAMRSTRPHADRCRLYPEWAEKNGYDSEGNRIHYGRAA